MNSRPLICGALTAGIPGENKCVAPPMTFFCMHTKLSCGVATLDVGRGRHHVKLRAIFASTRKGSDAAKYMSSESKNLTRAAI